MARKKRQRQSVPVKISAGHVSTKTGYARRAESLEILGFSTYADYLASPLWKSIRSRVLRLAKGNCKACWRTATQVHHRHYSLAVMAGDDISSLVALCRPCHEHAEFDEQQKVGLGVANKRLADRKNEHQHAVSISPKAVVR